MNRTPFATIPTFEKSARERLVSFLSDKRLGDEKDILELTPDASTRLYFRIPWQRSTAIASVYPEPFDADVHPFLEITRLFTEAHLPVPLIHEIAAAQGLIIQEDLGDRQLYNLYATASEDEVEAHKEQAISLIAEIQATTDLAVA